MPPNFYAVSYGLALSPAARDHVRRLLTDAGARLLDENEEADASFTNSVAFRSY